eukprot:GHRR01021072.1.p2 GENE.GHRR01021072.1~~GHRR01021072.1.p2  ORF type:complete len:109 (+),score=2.66 GHRR01021072.1:184-510(+)
MPVSYCAPKARIVALRVFGFINACFVIGALPAQILNRTSAVDRSPVLNGRNESMMSCSRTNPIGMLLKLKPLLVPVPPRVNNSRLWLCCLREAALPKAPPMPAVLRMH